MAIGVKVFSARQRSTGLPEVDEKSGGRITLQEAIDKWLETEKPDGHIQLHQAVSEGHVVLSFVYEKNSGTVPE